MRHVADIDDTSEAPAVPNVGSLRSSTALLRAPVFATAGGVARSERRRTGARPLPGTPGTTGYWDSKLEANVIKLLPGEFFVTRRREVLTTILGSCIAACIRDPVAGVGGMNHFMLPESEDGSECWGHGLANAGNRYGAYAMENLINTLLKYGAHRERMEVKLFGGGRIIPGMSDVGARNIAFVHRFLDAEGIPIAAESVGEDCPRKVNYLPLTGDVFLKKLKRITAGGVAQAERAYMDDLAKVPVSGDVELFS